MESFWLNWLYQDWGRLWKKTFSFSLVCLTQSTSAKINWTRPSLPDTLPMAASGEYIGNSFYRAWGLLLSSYLPVGALSPVWSLWTSRTRSGCTWSGRGATLRTTPTPCSPGEKGDEGIIGDSFLLVQDSLQNVLWLWWRRRQELVWAETWPAGGGGEDLRLAAGHSVSHAHAHKYAGAKFLSSILL